MVQVAKCVHHWLVGDAGAASCRKCGGERVFEVRFLDSGIGLVNAQGRRMPAWGSARAVK